MTQPDSRDEPRIMCGPTPETHGIGTRPFDALVKSIATSATRVGEAANYGLFFWRVLPDDVAMARDKLREAQKLLLGAHALLRAAAAFAQPK
jgi:hypothetical protein